MIENPSSRFDRLAVDASEEYAQPPAPGADEDAPSRPRVLYFRDPSRSAISWNQSPDLPFDASINPYRGCTHGCVYCYARPTHEYLGFSAGLDFETRILVKEALPDLLAKELGSPHWKPQPIAIGGVTDPYQPVERRLGITRRCLEVLLAHRNPTGVVTKGPLVTRDVDLLAALAGLACARVMVSITSLDRQLQRSLEPGTAPPEQRLEAVAELARAGVPVGVLVAPVIPGLNEHEMPAIVEAAARAGAGTAGHVMLKLPHGVKELFSAWLERHYPDRREKVLSKLRAMRGGKLDDPRFHLRQRGTGYFAEQTHALFDLACRRAGIAGGLPPLSTAAFRRPDDRQLSLFGGAPATP